MEEKLMQKILIFVGVFSVLTFATYGFSLDPTGMAKPVSGLRDYNGTYDGAVGTGSIGYTTLYRDNEDGGAGSGCYGEGCGRHPGVDIPLPVGTKVYAVTWGQVVISRCDDSWGGLIVLRGQSPYNGETIYITYAHLSAREYSDGSPVLAGHYVSSGVQIAKSGGKAGATCSGNSTGAHLHFQIDRDDGNVEPWFPAKNQLNQRDDNYMVSGKTFNPVVFITGGYRWSFNHNGDRELWDLFNIQSWGVGNGALYVDAGFDPYIRRSGLTNCSRGKPCSSGIAAEASNFPEVYLDLYNNCSSGIGRIYFTTNTSTNWSEDKSVPYLSNYGAQQTHVWMPSSPRWNGIITGLRIDPAENCSTATYDPTYYGEITIEH